MVMAVVVGFVVASGMKDVALKTSVMRLLAPVGLVGGLFAVMMFLWYLSTLPTNALVMLRAHLLPRYAGGMIAVFIVTTAYLLFGLVRPQAVCPVVAIALLLFLATVGVWPEERMREIDAQALRRRAVYLLESDHRA